MKFGLYALVTVSPEGISELVIGEDIPGLPSHGASVGPYHFDTIAQACACAKAKGVPEDRVYVGYYSAQQTALSEFDANRVHPDPDFDPTPW